MVRGQKGIWERMNGRDEFRGRERDGGGEERASSERGRVSMMNTYQCGAGEADLFHSRMGG